MAVAIAEYIGKASSHYSRSGSISPDPKGIELPSSMSTSNLLQGSLYLTTPGRLSICKHLYARLARLDVLLIIQRHFEDRIAWQRIALGVHDGWALRAVEVYHVPPRVPFSPPLSHFAGHFPPLLQEAVKIVISLGTFCTVLLTLLVGTGMLTQPVTPKDLWHERQWHTAYE